MPTQASQSAAQQSTLAPMQQQQQPQQQQTPSIQQQQQQQAPPQSQQSTHPSLMHSVSQHQNQQQLGLQMSHPHPYAVPQPHAQQTPATQPYKQQAASAQQLGGTQYRAPFPQLSPQMSPRSHQISPHPQMSPRSSVMSPAKPMQTQNVSNPLSPHGHLTAAAGPTQSRQMAQAVHQQVAKPTAAAQASSVSTLQALEQMVMPPTVSAPIMQPASMDSWYPQAPAAAQHSHAANTLTPMTAATNVPQHHQPWQSMARGTSAVNVAAATMPGINHQQAAQQQMGLLSPQMANVSQAMNDMVPNRVAPYVANTKQMNPMLGAMGQSDATANLAQLDHMQHMQSSMSANPLIPNSQPTSMHQSADLNATPISTSSVISASSNLLDPFAGVVEPIAPVIVTSVGNTANSLLDSALSAANQAMDTGLGMSQEQMLSQHSLGMQSNVHSDSLQSDGRSSMLDKSMSMGQTNSLADNSAANVAAQMQLPVPVSQSMSVMHDTDSLKDQNTHQDHNSGPLPRISDAFDTPLISDAIKPMDTNDLSNEPNDSMMHKSEDSRSQEAIPSFDMVKQSLGSDTSMQNDVLGNNGLNDDNAMQQAPTDADNQMTDTTFSTTTSIDNVIGQDTQSMSFDQSSNHSQYSMPAVPQTTVNAPSSGMPPVGPTDPTQTIYGANPYDPMMTNVVPQMPMMQNYPPPLSHHAEKTMIQQQLSELYCIPPTPEIHEKIKRLDDRMKLLQQHETNEQCMGGPQCVLLNPMMTAPMIESPQVSSTTGRGRGRSTSAKPRKPRQKKADKQQQQQQSPGDGNADSGDVMPSIKATTDQLPVSEDCVTQGAGLAADDMLGELNDANDGEDGLQEDGQELDTSTTADGKKPKKPRRKPKDPNRPKERSRKQRDPNEPKKKSRGKKSEPAVDSVDTSDINQSVNETADESTLKDADGTLNSDGVTDFDDIPVSKIPIKSLLEEAAKKDAADNESAQSDIETSTPKRNRRSSGGRSSGRRRRGGGARGSAKKGNRSRARIIVESDGEGEDLGEFNSFHIYSCTNFEKKQQLLF